MDIRYTCCFSGHRPEVLYAYGEDENSIYRAISAAVQDAVLDGYTDFLCGGSRGADMLFARCVADARQYSRDIQLHCILPCRNQAELWSDAERSQYADMLDSADSVICLREKYATGCMQARNRYMVDRSSLLISTYYRGQSGGTKYTVGYARKSGLRVVNLLGAPPTDSNQLKLF